MILMNGCVVQSPKTVICPRIVGGVQLYDRGALLEIQDHGIMHWLSRPTTKILWLTERSVGCLPDLGVDAIAVRLI
jgi:hypothetical protein